MLDDPNPPSRRAFVTSALAAGFALAVRPVSAQTITTDAAGLEAGEVKIPAQGGQMPAYRAMPKTGGPVPVVMVVHEIFGVHEHIKDVCRRLAKAGMLAVAPDLYARFGDVSKLPDWQEVMKVVTKVPDEQVMADLDATAAWAKASGRAAEGKLSITGFCWGGRIVWMYAAHAPKLKAGVAWYGRISDAHNAQRPKHPIDVAGALKAPVLGLYAGLDGGIPVAHVELMRREVAQARGPSEIVVYDGAQHGFYADYRPTYKKDAADDAWKRMGEWLKRHGAA
jgi:carboxymethylenebutenolidase